MLPIELFDTNTKRSNQFDFHFLSIRCDNEMFDEIVLITISQLPLDQKSKVGHRGSSLRQLLQPC